jgi:hypothetical protein
MKKILLLLLLLFPSIAFGQSSFTVLDSTGATQTFKSFNCSASICAMAVLADTTGASILGTAGSANSNVLTVQGIASGTALNIAASALPLPTGAATSALQTTGNTALTTINTTLGSPFQAGGSIGNSSFGAT